MTPFPLDTTARDTRSPGRASVLGVITLARDARGVVYVEFLIAFTPIFVFFLALVQLSLIGVARIVVQHAAVRGARAAVVVLDDDPARYDGAKRLDVRAPGRDDGRWDETLDEQLGGTGDGSAGGTRRHRYGGTRMRAIARAVHVPLAAITPEPQAALGELGGSASVGRALGDAPLLRLLYGLHHHAGLTTAITFPAAPGEKQLRDGKLPADEPVTVRVTHLFLCSVPIARRLVCGSLGWNLRARALRSADRNLAGILAELAHAPGAALHPALTLSGASFAVLQAEATLPAQVAPYRYRSERKGHD